MPVKVWLRVCVPVKVEDIVDRPVAPGVAPFDTDCVKDGEGVWVVVWVCVMVREGVRLPVVERVEVFVPLEVIVNEGVWDSVCADV